MSRETTEWLNQHTLIGMGRKAWHFNASAQGDESNHYPGAIPAADVRRRLFSWDAVPVELMYEFNDKVVEIDHKIGVAHGETGVLLNVVSPSYEILQYQDCLLAGVEKILGNDLGIESAGLLSQGGIGWVSVSLPDTTVTAEGVEFLPHLLAFASHNSKFAVGFKRTATLVVCDNTLAIGLAESGSTYRIRHTKNSAIRIEDAHAALGLLMETEDEFSRQIKDLCETEVSDRQWAKFVEAYVPLTPEEQASPGRSTTVATKKRESLTEMYRSDPRVSDWTGTAFGVVQAANTWLHHSAPVYKGGDRQERNMMNTLSGAVDIFDKRTLDTLNLVLTNA